MVCSYADQRPRAGWRLGPENHHWRTAAERRLGTRRRSHNATGATSVVKSKNERNKMKDGKLNGKVAVVTGASKGIGAGIAKHLAAEGAAVVVKYATSKEGADRVVDEITKRGGKAIAVQAHIATKKEVERLFAETKKAFGQLDILVNNAGVYQFAPLEQVTEDEFHQQFNTNVFGLILTTQQAAQHFGQEGGSVINVSSVASTATPPAAAV